MYVIVRTTNAGVFAGTLEESELAAISFGPERSLVLSGARRLWYWDGAATLSELATRGTSKPATCKFPAEVESILITEVIEVIPVSVGAQATIAAVPVWTV